MIDRPSKRVVMDDCVAGSIYSFMACSVWLLNGSSGIRMI